MEQAHIFVSGKVQGVFFRKYTQKQAKALGLVGWVQNLPDGRVEATAEGKPEDVERLVQWCKTKGSPKSHVTNVECTKRRVTAATFTSFDITGKGE